MERKVGEVIDYNGVTLTTIENDSCEGCFFNSTTNHSLSLIILTFSILQKESSQYL